MRAGPLSDDKIIRLINSYYVPFYLNFADYFQPGETGVAQQDKALFHKMIDGFQKIGASTGTVHVYVSSPDFQPLGSLHVAEAIKPEVLKPFLNDFVVKQNILAAEPVFAPRPQSVPPPASKGSLILHVFIRGIEIVPEFPHENWVVLSPNDIARLLPANAMQAGTSWMLDMGVASKFGEWLHPTLDWLVNEPLYQTRIDTLDIRATTLPSSGEYSVAKLEGKIAMARPAYGYTGPKAYVTANLMGYMRFNSSHIVSFELAVKDAFYYEKEFEGFVESAPVETPRQFVPRNITSLR